MKQEFVTLPRAVVDQAIAALTDLAGWRAAPLCDLLRAALEQPKNHIEQHLGMVPAGWRLVPVEPTAKMVDAARSQSSFPAGVWRAMLDAAPQPPASKDPNWPKLEKPARVGGGTFGIGTSSKHVVDAAQRAHDEHVRAGNLTHEQMAEEERKRRALWDMINGSPEESKPKFVWQPQGEQKPRVWLHIDRLGGEQAFTNEPPPSLKARCQPLYTHSQNLNCKSNQARLATLWGYEKKQPPRQPLTDDEIADAVRGFYSSDEAAKLGFPDDACTARAVEAAHNIK